MEGEGETSARVETKSGRKKKVRECELHPQHLWCAPCQNRRTKRPCEGPRTHMPEATVPVSATKDKTDTLSQAACATASTDPSVVRSRPVRTSAARDAEGDSRSIGESRRLAVNRVSTVNAVEFLFAAATGSAAGSAAGRRWVGCGFLFALRPWVCRPSMSTAVMESNRPWRAARDSKESGCGSRLGGGVVVGSCPQCRARHLSCRWRAVSTGNTAGGLNLDRSCCCWCLEAQFCAWRHRGDLN